MNNNEEVIVRAKAVELILKGEAEKALEILSKHYRVNTPKIEIGLPKRCRKALGCYVSGKKTIYLRSSEQYRDPFILLHEYYHHLRTFMNKHRGTEKHADKYALESIKYYLYLANIIEEISKG